jgi:hypothetical protein
MILEIMFLMLWLLLVDYWFLFWVETFGRRGGLVPLWSFLETLVLQDQCEGIRIKFKISMQRYLTTVSLTDKREVWTKLANI